MEVGLRPMALPLAWPDSRAHIAAHNASTQTVASNDVEALDDVTTHFIA